MTTMSRFVHRFSVAALALFACLTGSAQDDPAAVTRWKLGVVIRAEASPAMGINAGVPIFTEWPEQEVKTVSQGKSENVKQVTFRKLGDGAMHLVVNVPKLGRGEMAEASLT